MSKSLRTGVVLAGTVLTVGLGTGIAAAAPAAPAQFTVLESSTATPDPCGSHDNLFEDWLANANAILTRCDGYWI